MVSPTMELNLRELPHLVVGSLMEVHKELGPGLLLEAYWASLAHEFRLREILFGNGEAES